MDAIGIERRLALFAQRFWQPTSACLTCMPGSLGRLGDLGHWEIAVQTGLGSGALLLLLTSTPARALLRRRFGNAAVVVVLIMLGDAYSHPSHDGIRWGEVVITGLTSGAFALVASVLLQDRGRRLRRAWSALRPRA
jgi:hypothetical protein